MQSLASVEDTRRATRTRFAWHALLLWHLCSLDAPTIAVLWAWALGHGAGLKVRWQALGMLALGAWLVYVIDRLLDASAGETTEQVLEARHHFHARHRKLLLGLSSMAGIGILLLSRQASPRLVAVDAALLLPVGAYAAAVHRGPRSPGGSRGKLSGSTKEASVALLFSAAVLAPALVGARPASRLLLLALGALFALLCWLNCACISLAESRPRTSTAGRSNRAAVRRLIFAASLLAACSALYGCRAGERLGAELADCMSLTALLLLGLVLDCRSLGQSAVRSRVMADLALLTPIVLLAAPGLHSR